MGVERIPVLTDHIPSECLFARCMREVPEILGSAIIKEVPIGNQVFWLVNPFVDDLDKSIDSLSESIGQEVVSGTSQYFFIPIDLYPDNHINSIIMTLDSFGLPTYLVKQAYTGLDEDVVAILGSNIYNVFQYNVNPNKESCFQFVGENFYFLKSSGIFTIMKVTPIIQGITINSKLLELVGSLCNFVHHITFAVSGDEEYKSNLQDILTMFLRGKKITFSVCTSCESGDLCFGNYKFKSGGIIDV